MRAGTSAVVVGGGLAGIAAAVRLADAGRAVTLLESRPWLGGRAHSFERGPLRVDNGQHVILRCYHSYRELLTRLGVEHLVPLQPRLDIPVLLPTGLTRVRRGGMRPAPLHLAPALLGYAGLSVGERLGVTRAAVALRRVDPDDPRADEQTFGSWLRAHGQGARAVRRLWGLLIVPALNIEAEEASLALAARVFRTGVLDEVAAGDIGVPHASLSELHDLPARALLAGLGVDVRTSTRVTAVTPRPGGFAVTSRPRGRGSYDTVAAGEVVLAVPPEPAARIVPAQGVPDAQRWLGLGSSAIVNAHFLFDRRVTDVEFLAAPDSPVQWVFDRSAVSGLSGGRYLVTSLSAAGDVLGAPSAVVLREQLAALGELLPAVRTASVRDSFVTREPAATFRQRAGTARLRPAPGTALPGLALAGAWTATGWPDTMEGAVMSGHAAAARLLDESVQPARAATDGRSPGERVPA
jgi:squalene-associated FAD-dependent desaturase